MKLLSRKDLLCAVSAGVLTGLIIQGILIFLKTTLPWHVAGWWLVFIVPVCWILGVQLGYFLGRWFHFFDNFGKFSAIGFANAAVDFGVLNLSIYLSGINHGLWISGFKVISFIVAVTHSFLWNRYWVFDEGRSGSAGGAYAKFMGVMIVSLGVNVAVFSLIVNFVHPPGNLEANTWANLSAAAGSAVALVVSFVGFRTVVFKK